MCCKENKFQKELDRKLEDSSEGEAVNRITFSMTSYLMVLSLILVHAKAVYSFDASWTMCFMPVIVILIIRLAILILSCVSSYLLFRIEKEENYGCTWIDDDNTLNPDE